MKYLIIVRLWFVVYALTVICTIFCVFKLISDKLRSKCEIDSQLPNEVKVASIKESEVSLMVNKSFTGTPEFEPRAAIKTNNDYDSLIQIRADSSEVSYKNRHN